MRFRYTPLQIAVHLGAWFPLALLAFDFFTGSLSANPIQDLERRTGSAALTLLVLMLACTPLNALFGWQEALKRRRALGLYAFMYASIHLLVFAGLDYGLSWALILDAVVEKRFVLIGTAAFLLFIPLAVTSFRFWMVRMGKNWKRLHRLVYVIAPLAVVHFAWARKGDIFRLQGDIMRPLVYGLIVLLLLGLRLPPLRRAAVSFRTRVLLLVPGRDPTP
ncbi:MAG: sulfoxide reductase heme-binding subunit YedZ [Chloroflexi bacterium]|nr:sulfoxide reductase heme-binding subunit YedZ [Chloroflexota bacterium]